jgi:hypothetical protein
VCPWYPFGIVAKPKPPSSAEQTLEQLLDKVSNAREELVTVERTLERLKADIAKAQKNNGSSKPR